MNKDEVIRDAVRDVMVALGFGVTDDLAAMEIEVEDVQTAERL